MITWIYSFLWRNGRLFRAIGLILALLFVWARWAPMDPLFDDPYSTVLEDRSGRLLGASVAADGQWRMPPGTTIPTRFAQSLLLFEDRHFHAHWGIHFPSLMRAAMQNRRAGRIVSGGSTITMQLARMARGSRERTRWNKALEILLALRIELRFSKPEILALYCANAPFGGNVVGLEAGAWRWFGQPPEQLSWAQCATLAVLPNAPSRMHPGRARDALKAKRDRLLGRMLHHGLLDSVQWSLALEEHLPDEPLQLPRKATHLLGTMQSQGYVGQRLRTTLDGGLQEQVTALADRYAAVLRANEVHNAAVLVMDVGSGEVLAYCGNLASATQAQAGMVDIVQAKRSTGSLLKPFLHAAMLQSGELMPQQLVADIPTQFEGFVPQNFDRSYQGAVPANMALARSLNVPAVRALRTHGVDRFLRVLRGMGLHSIDRSADHYGLSLVVGGAESSLWELTGAYASMARIVASYTGEGNTQVDRVHPPHLLKNEGTVNAPKKEPVLRAGAIHHTLEALRSLNRPESEHGWDQFARAHHIAWKTGTSFGHRDAWAIGVTERYAVGVWTGNASGEGRPGLTGSLAAAPLLFDVFARLERSGEPPIPYDALRPTPICRTSGHRATVDCSPVDTLQVLHEAMRTAPCPYHHRILVNTEGIYRVRPGPSTRAITWFTLPPAMEAFYRAGHPGYRTLPPWHPDAAADEHDAAMELIYPAAGAQLFIPRELQGGQGQVVFHAVHRDPDAVIHWHVDHELIGTTRADHRITTSLLPGQHALTLMDHRGRELRIHFSGTNDPAQP